MSRRITASHPVVAIGLVAPLAAFACSGDAEQIEVVETPTVVEAPALPEVPDLESDPPPAREDNGPAAEPASFGAEQAAAITAVDESHFRIDRAAFVETNTMQLGMTSARLSPVTEAGGVRLTNVGEGSLFAALGLREEDVLLEIRNTETDQAFSLDSPVNALRAYDALRDASAIALQISRGDTPLTIEYTIQ